MFSEHLRNDVVAGTLGLVVTATIVPIRMLATMKQLNEVIQGKKILS